MKHFKNLCIVLFFTFLFNPVSAQEKIHIYLFYSNQCPHCANEITWLDHEYADDPEVDLYYFELGDYENQSIFEEVQDFLNEPARGVPYLIIEDDVFTGFMFGITDETISNKINDIKKGSYHDPLGLITKTRLEDIQGSIETKDKIIKIPFLKEINAETASLPFLAVMMGLVDGFNPCAMWVLIFLISMLLPLKDHKNMWILGLTFIFTSGFIYYLFMFTWLNVSMILPQTRKLQTATALLAGGFGIYNISTFLNTYKNKGCEIINDSRRTRIMHQVKNITSKQKLIISLFSVISLAIMVNLFELMCSLGLPVVFTQILSMNRLTPWQTQLYLLIYILFFLIDDLLIFTIAMKTLKIKGISNRYAKYSHLLGGIIMIVLGSLMFFKPEWLMLNF